MTADQFIQSLHATHYQHQTLLKINEFFDAFESIKHTHAAYYCWLDDSDLSDFDNLIQLIIQAPTESIKYWLMGKIDLEKYCFLRLRKTAVAH